MELEETENCRANPLYSDEVTIVQGDRCSDVTTPGLNARFHSIPTSLQVVSERPSTRCRLVWDIYCVFDHRSLNPMFLSAERKKII